LVLEVVGRPEAEILVAAATGETSDAARDQLAASGPEEKPGAQPGGNPPPGERVQD
jgi:hypothetical protein